MTACTRVVWSIRPVKPQDTPTSSYDNPSSKLRLLCGLEAVLEFIFLTPVQNFYPKNKRYYFTATTIAAAAAAAASTAQLTYCETLNFCIFMVLQYCALLSKLISRLSFKCLI